MNWIRQRAVDGELLVGIGAQIGSQVSVELAGRVGFDWVWVDLEHGTATDANLLSMLQAAAVHDMPAIVRLPANELRCFKQALDFGAAGVMVPYVSTPDEAAHAASCMRYPPAGQRGVAQSTRASMYGLDFDSYPGQADENALLCVQIETPEAVDNVEAIATVDGADVLFVGPLDLTTSMGIQRQFEHPDFTGALERVVAACRAAGKVPGVLAPTLELGRKWRALGFSFFVGTSDGSILARGMSEMRAAWRDV